MMLDKILSLFTLTNIEAKIADNLSINIFFLAFKKVKLKN